MWLEILKNDITDQNTLDVLKILLDSTKHEERAGIIAKKLKYSHCAACNGIIAAYGKRIIDTYLNIKCPKHENGKYALFHVSLLAKKKGWLVLAIASRISRSSERRQARII